MQEFRTGAVKQSMESEHAKEETKRLRTQMTELRDKMNDLEARVRSLISISSANNTGSSFLQLAV